MRKAFNFYYSYYEVATKLPDKDRLAFLDALLKKQFTGQDTILKGMAEFAYISQRHSIDSQINGWEFKTKQSLNQCFIDATEGGCQGGSNGGCEQEKGEEKEKEEILKIDFEIFWKLYDKKTGKQKCNEEWKKLKPLEQKQIIDCLPKYKKEKPDPQFRKDPIRFITHKLWIDYLDSDGSVILEKIERPTIWEIKERIVDGFYTAEYAKENFNYDFETHKFLD